VPTYDKKAKLPFNNSNMKTFNSPTSQGPMGTVSTLDKSYLGMS
jgi:hypothetical protein